MRMRRLKWAGEYLENCELVVKTPEALKGKWNAFLQKESISVEIGCGKGDFFIGMSKLYPDQAWVAIERNESVAAIAAKKCGEPYENTRMIVGDAANIEDWFGKEEIDAIYLNFSDPWPKKRNQKRRLSHPDYLRRYDFILKPDGFIQMKSDNASLYEFTILSMQDYGFRLLEMSVDYHRIDREGEVLTEYERKFMEMKQPIYFARWRKGGTNENAHE